MVVLLFDHVVYTTSSHQVQEVKTNGIDGFVRENKIRILRRVFESIQTELLACIGMDSDLIRCVSMSRGLVKYGRH